MGLWVCVSPSPGRIVAPIVVIFGTRVLCRPGKVIGYQKILSLAHAAQKKRAAGLSSHSFAPIGVKIATRLLCHPAKILSRASLAHAAQKKRAARAVCPSSRSFAPIGVKIATRLLCHPADNIGYSKKFLRSLSRASRTHAAQKKRAAGPSSHSFAPIGVKIVTRLL